MNRIYRLVWNRALRTLQVVSELAHCARAGISTSQHALHPRAHKPLAIALASILALGMGAFVPAVAATNDITTAGGHGGGDNNGAYCNCATGGNAGIAGGGGGGGGAGGVGGNGANQSNAAGSGAGANSSSGGSGGGGLTGGGGGGGGYGGSGNSNGGNGATGLESSAATYQVSSGSTLSGGQGANGGDGGNNRTGGGGGGGGALVLTAAGAQLNNAGTIAGGNGGSAIQSNGIYGAGAGGGGAGVVLMAGGAITNASGGQITGGDGGNGDAGDGAAAVFLLAGGTLTNNTGATIAGGAGSGGGSNVNSLGGNGAAGVLSNRGVIINGGSINGGQGGSAYWTGGDGGTGATINGGSLLNTGAISGGVGGTGQTNGAGGVGLQVYGGASIDNGGTISGGLSGNGTRADAIDFSGGANTLTLEVGYIITGHVVSSSGSTNGGDTLALGGTTNGNFDVSQIGGTAQYQGFANYAKTGSSTWTLTNITTAVTPWTISAGTLSVSSDSTLGATTGALTLNGGTLQTTSPFTTSRNIVIGGSGGTIQANGALNLNGSINGSGALTVNNSGATTFGGTVGGTTALTSLTTDAGGSTTLGGNVTTSSYQVYNDAVSLGGNDVLASTSGGAIYFASTLDGAQSLIVNTTGAATFGGAVGSTFALNSLTVNSGTFSADTLNIGSVGLAVTTSGGSIGQNGAFIVAGTSSFNAGANAITLTNTGNDFAGAVSLNNTGNNNVTLSNGGSALVLGASSIGSGTLHVTGNSITQLAGSSITQAAGAGAANFNAGTGALALTNAGNDLTGAVTAVGSDVSITNAGDLNIASLTTTGNIALNTTSGVLSVNTAVSGGDINLNSAGALTLGYDVTGSTVELASGGNIVQTGGVITANTLTGSSVGSTSLTDANLIGTLGSFSAGSFSLGDQQALTIAGTLTASSVTLADSQGIVVTGALNAVTTSFGTGTSLQIGNGGMAGSLSGAVVDNGTLAFDHSDAVSFAGAISGSGSLLQQGTGKLTLDGNSSAFTGSTEVRSGGLIVGSVAGNGAALGGNVTVDSGALLGGHGTIGGNVDVLNGAHLAPGDSIGTLTVIGNLTAAQGSVLDYAFGAPGATFASFGTGDSVKVGDNLALNGATLNVTDAGGFGPGLYNLFTYDGTLTESNGGITLGTTPTGAALTIQNLTGSKQINLLNTTGLTLNFWNGNGLASATQLGGGSGSWSATSPNWTDATGSVSAAIQPQPGFAIFADAPGTVTIDNSAGNVSTTGLQFASNGYTLTGDTLTLVGSGGVAPIIRVGNGSTAGTAYIATINNVLAGVDGLTKADYGTLVLTGSNIYSGGTAINGGTLSVSSDANLGATAGALTLDGGILEVTGTAFNGTTRSITLGNAGGGFDIADAGNTFTVAQPLAGSGGLSKTGAGLLALTGVNTYSGGTTISAGTLQGDTTSLQGNITDNAALVFNQNTTGTFAGTISGTGSLIQSGSGLLTLDGDSSAFTGTTTVQAGTLEVGDAATAAAFLGGNVQVDAGGTLRGHGTIGGNVVNDGTLWPGGSIGTLTVQGKYTQGANSVLNIDAAPTGQASLLAVSGTASLQGGSAVVLAQAGNWAPRTDYTILTAAGGITGQFTSASSSLLFLNPVLSYTANAVNLSLQRNDISFASVAQTPNQRAVATAADGLGFGNPAYSALTTLDAPTAQHAFDQLSGVIHASTSTALIDDSRYVRDAINRHLLGLNNDGAEGATADGVSVWTSTWGHGGHNDDDVNAAALQANGSGLLLGADLPLNGNTRLGAVLGHGQNSIQSNSVGSSAHVLGDHAGVYGSSTFGAFVLRAGAVYSWQDVHSNRAVAFGNYSDWLTSEHHAQTAQAYVEGGYQFNVSPGQQLEPFVNVARVRVHEDALQEGGGAAALAVASNSASVNTATLGLRDTLALDAAGGIHAHASVGWQQAWGDLTPVTSMRFVDGGDSFAIAGMPVARHAAVADLGVDFKLAKNVTFDVSYLGQFASGVQDQGARMSLTVTF